MSRIISLNDLIPVVEFWKSSPKIKAPEHNSIVPEPDEATIQQKPLTEGEILEVIRKEHLRNQTARKQCIEKYGTKCQICEFDFAEVFGAEFSGLIHVHHKTPLSASDERHPIDPINDLIPVCPNCHFALHSKPGGIYTPEELRAFQKSKQ